LPNIIDRININQNISYWGVAKSSRVHDWGSSGRKFKSCRPDQYLYKT